MTPKISIVTGTLDRLPMLRRCIDGARAACGRLRYEIIIVDGGSMDGTREYLLEQDDVLTIWQGERLGAVAAFNAGFAAAQGTYVVNLNDDAICIGPILSEAVAIMQERPRVGQIALPFSDPRHGPAVHSVRVGKYNRNVLYANFGVTRRALGQRLGWWGNHSHHYGGDTELSLQIWNAGFEVAPLLARPDCYIEHHRAQDGTRLENDGEGRRLGYRWRSWEGPKESRHDIAQPI